jgi:hypothetical protein
VPFAEIETVGGAFTFRLATPLADGDLQGPETKQS